MIPNEQNEEFKSAMHTVRSLMPDQFTVIRRYVEALDQEFQEKLDEIWDLLRLMVVLMDTDDLDVRDFETGR